MTVSLEAAARRQPDGAVVAARAMVYRFQDVAVPAAEAKARQARLQQRIPGATETPRLMPQGSTDFKGNSKLNEKSSKSIPENIIPLF